MKHIIYTWDDFRVDAKMIVAKLDMRKYNSIAPVAFGGLTLGTMLKNVTKLPTRVIFASSYDGSTHKKLKLHIGNITKLQSRVLVVEDIADTGHTLRSIADILSKHHIEFDTLTLFYKTHSVYKPTYHLHTIDDDVWVTFPWEII